MNLLASALWDLIQFPTYRGAGLIADVRAPKKGPVGRAIAEAATDLGGVLTGASAAPEAVKSFLASSAVEEIVADLYAAGMTDRPTLTEIRVAFDAQWREQVEDLGDKPGIGPDGLFDDFVEACNAILDVAVGQNILAAHDAKSSARHRLLDDRLATIHRLVAAQATGAVDEVKLAAYERQMTSTVGDRHARIEPPSFQVRHRVPLEKLYVTPHLRLRARDETREITFASFLASMHRRVVLGAPGGGKSTLTFKLCHLMAERFQDPSKPGRRLTPWRIELRRYAAAHGDSQISLIEYFERFAATSYSLAPEPGFFEALLDRGGLLVIFDGLDELLDPADRTHVREAIESFCRRFPRTSVVVTSRFIGYDQAPLDPDVFDVVELSEFTTEQTATYVGKWFSREEGIPPPEQRELADAFMDESRQVADLRRNPLLLALMCAFYRGRGFIPNNLPDVYGSCAQLLFETWDKSRGIDPLLPFSRHIRPALNDLAHWIFTSPGLTAGGVTRSQAIARTAEFLGRYRFADPTEAHAAAAHFVEFCRGRAWVFSDTGEMRAGEEVFAFTHRTFLEFFCAEYLQASHASPTVLVDALLDRVGAPGWEIVTRVALQMKSRTVLNGADLVIGQLGYHAERADLAERAEIQQFVLRALGALVPSPTTVFALTNSVLTTVARMALAVGGDELPESDDIGLPAARRLLGSLASVESELASQLQDALIQILTEAITEPSRTGRVASEIFFWARTLEAEGSLVEAEGSLVEAESVIARELSAHDALLDQAEPPERQFWRQVCERGVASHSEMIRGATGCDLYVALDAFWAGAVGVRDLYEGHSWPALLAHRRLLLAGRSTRSVASEILVSAVASEWRDHERGLQQVKNLSRIIAEDGYPRILSLDSITQYRIDEPLVKLSYVVHTGELDGDDWATVWALAALEVELSERFSRRRASKDALVALVSPGRDKRLRALGAVLLNRWDATVPLEDAFDVLELGGDARGTIQNWTRRDLSFIG